MTMHRAGYAVAKALLGLAVLALPRAPLRHHEPSLELVVVAIVLCSAAYVVVQGSDPGYLTEELLRDAMEADEDDTNGLTTEEEDEEEDHGDELRSPAKQAEKSYRLRRIQQIQAALARSGTHAQETKADEDEDEDAFDREIDAMQCSLEQQPLATQRDVDAADAFCVECDLFPPLRAHHCRDCRRCVATFDHHCYMLGTCVGERNHARFWWFLVLQTLEVLLGILTVTARFQPAKPKSSWTHANGWPLFLLLVLSLLLLFVGGMLAFHTFLAMGNMTTYEFGRGTDKIAYLRGFRECDLPFSRGLLRNLAFFCCPRRLKQLCERSYAPVTESASSQTNDDKIQLREQTRSHAWRPALWKPPAPILDRDSDKICENLWENKYYSCC